MEKNADTYLGSVSAVRHCVVELKFLFFLVVRPASSCVAFPCSFFSRALNVTTAYRVRASLVFWCRVLIISQALEFAPSVVQTDVNIVHCAFQCVRCSHHHLVLLMFESDPQDASDTVTTFSDTVVHQSLSVFYRRIWFQMRLLYYYNMSSYIIIIIFHV